MTLGKKLHDLRRNQRLTLKDASGMLGLKSTSYLAAIEADRKPPSLSTLTALAKIYDTRVSQIFAAVEGNRRLTTIRHGTERGAGGYCFRSHNRQEMTDGQRRDATGDRRGAGTQRVG